jgi:isopenicillin-N N-acyltransferase like protein
MKLIKVEGDPYQIGLQHGRQVRPLRARIRQTMQATLATLEGLEVDLGPYEQELETAWDEIDRPMMEMLRGMSQALELPWQDYFRYTTASYLADRAGKPGPGQGCTSWAANGRLTRDGGPVLAKNRDYRPDHRGMQVLAQTRPAEGYAYISLGSAGSPGVFSSGMNEKGLAAADTHVISTDVGPGLARSSAMMQILEGCSRVSEALEALAGMPHLGDGTITLADAHGDTAVFEAGHSRQGLIRPGKGYVVATNHYTSEGLREAWLDTSPFKVRGHTLRRYARVVKALEEAEGAVDLAYARRLMASHTRQRYAREAAALEEAEGAVDLGCARRVMASRTRRCDARTASLEEAEGAGLEPGCPENLESGFPENQGSGQIAGHLASRQASLEAICRHNREEPAAVTISSAFFLPRARILIAAGGRPCRAVFFSLRVGPTVNDRRGPP